MGSYRDDKGKFHHVDDVENIPVRFQGPECMGQTAAKYKNPILNEHEKTHGNFNNVARLHQKLLAIFDSKNSVKETDVQKEAYNMILLKLARARCGNPNEIDHWRDIVGYAELVIEDLEF
jgi:hypothetical protein